MEIWKRCAVRSASATAGAAGVDGSRPELTSQVTPELILKSLRFNYVLVMRLCAKESVLLSAEITNRVGDA
jgi:hypothetical protein